MFSIKNASSYLWLLLPAGLLLILRNRNKMSANDKLSKNFNWSEFASSDGAPMPPEVQENIKILAQQLEVIRAAVGRPVKINSGYRSPAWNKKVGGVPGSQHQYGRASDIRVEGMGSKQLHAVVLDLIEKGKIKQGGVGLYPTFVHYDHRGTKARWNG